MRDEASDEGGTQDDEVERSSSVHHSSVRARASSFIPHPSSLIPRLRRALRGRVDARAVALEAWRRSRTKLEQRRERAHLEQLAKQPARLRAEFARMPAAELLEHFRQRNTPKFFSGFNSISETANTQRALFPSETARLIESATRIANKHTWPLLG
ncbi:MAG: hypothetical protein WCB68_03090 [Pyrinomonadaceae bacterium]